MRANDFLTEKKQGKVSQELKAASPGSYSNPLDRYYGLYRASMIMARSPGNSDDIDTESQMGVRPYMGAYTEVDKQKIEAANKALGVKTTVTARGPSEELEGGNTVSPMTGAKWQRKK